MAMSNSSSGPLSFAQRKTRSSSAGNHSDYLSPYRVETDFFIKVLFLGDTGVGKSSMMHRFTEGDFASGLIGTAGVDHKMKNIEHMGNSVKI
mmetsp:Transcript_22250/g.15873  ORF Transcript_22250/g.15873 Transcript_22250/m.15873 type:complete len:92 (-) Transcript_22250:492-767(-)